MRLNFGRYLFSVAFSVAFLGVKNFDFDANLGPYPFETHKKWLSLSSHINQKVSGCFHGSMQQLIALFHTKCAVRLPVHASKEIHIIKESFSKSGCQPVLQYFCTEIALKQTIFHVHTLELAIVFEK